MPTTQHNPKLTDHFETFLRNYYKEAIHDLALHYPNEQTSISVDWRDLYQFDADLADDMIDEPDTILEFLETALARIDLPVDVDLTGAEVRITGLVSETYHVSETRSEHVNSYISVTGQVQKTSAVKPRITEAAFECQRCGTLKYIPQSGNFQEPYECQGCERQGPFSIDFDQSEFIDYQAVRLQEPPERTKGGEGEHIDAYLESDLVDAVSPGDRVEISGIYRIEEPDNKTDRAFDTYIDAKAIEIEQADFDEIAVEGYVEEIEAIAAGEEGDPYDLLVESIAPKVFGYDDVKEAIVLQLFGGWRHKNPDGTFDRGDSHIFLVGDPGSGKSTILRAVEDLAPRAVFTEGKGLTKAGATAAATRDDFGNTEWGLEAGVMVLANKGVACIDELDKVDYGAKESLHGALESQRVNINKAGINATLPAQTALLTAGNPSYGRFDRFEPIAEQLDLSPTLISRFDLIFTFKDEPDRDRDEQIAQHIVDARQTIGRLNRDRDVEDGSRALIEPSIDRELLRAYIAYAKQTVFPTIEDDPVKRRLVEFYTELRDSGDEDDDSPIPVTARKLDAIQRLAEASARIRLSETIEEQDIERAAKLVLKSMREVGRDPETGQFDVDVIESGRSMSQHGRRRTIIDLIEEHEIEEGPPTEDTLLDACESEGIDRARAENDLAVLKRKGEIYEPKDGRIRTS